MTVERGRARPGAASVLRALLAFGVVALFTSGCGSGTITYGTPIITFSAVPGPFTSYRLQVTQITLTRSDGAIVYPVGYSSGVSEPEIVDFAKLTERRELFGAPAEPDGTYTSASITVDYTVSAIFADVGGHNVPLTAMQIPAAGGAAVTAGAVTYTVTFDSSAPLVIKNGVSSPLDFNFDLGASSVVNLSASQVTVKPFMTASTAPASKPVRSRGLFVTASPTSSTFIINARPFNDVSSNPYGAINVQTDANTVYNINGATYTGTAGLTVMQQLQINTNIAVLGTVTNLNSITPTMTATQVFAGLSLDNALEDRISGVVVARSGNTLTLHGVSSFTRPGNATLSGLTLFQDSLPLTVGTATVVTQDGSAQALTAQAISVGQFVDIGGALLDSTGALVANTAATPTSIDATSGLVRLVSTPVWGTLNSGAMPGAASLNLLTLGGFEPTVFNFTGTGQGSAMDANPATYAVNTAPAAADESATLANTLLRVDGFVSPFGSAPPDFNAATVTPGSATRQILVVDWINGGTTAPFLSSGTAGLVVNIGNSNLGTSHAVLTGPTSLDLTNPAVNVTIVPDGTVADQLAIGSPAAGISVYKSFADFLTGLGSTLNGTNAVQKLVAVGHFDQPSGTFTASRINLVRE